VVGEEGPPGLRRRFRRLHHVVGDRILVKIDPELE
jgi:hypothetical protein